MTKQLRDKAADQGIVPDDRLRVSVRCEHVEDLWADLHGALASTTDSDLS